MGFPIVTGGAQSSTSLPLPTPDEVIRNVVASEERYEETHHHAGGGLGSSNDGGGIRHRMIGTPLVTAGTDASSKLCATMTISYVEATACVPSGDGDIDSKDGSTTATEKYQQQHVGLTAEVRVSITPTAASLSKRTRETTCRIRLPSGIRRGKGAAAVIRELLVCHGGRLWSCSVTVGVSLVLPPSGPRRRQCYSKQQLAPALAVGRGLETRWLLHCTRGIRLYSQTPNTGPRKASRRVESWH